MMRFYVSGVWFARVRVNTCRVDNFKFVFLFFCFPLFKTRNLLFEFAYTLN